MKRHLDSSCYRIQRLNLVIFCCLLIPGCLHATILDKIFLSKDQQAQRMMNKHDYLQAKQLFKRKDWRAVAAYRAGQYEDAAALFKQLNTADGYYNQGNALAYMGRYDEAIRSFNKALVMNPKHQDASYNRKILQALVHEQQKKAVEPKSKSNEEVQHKKNKQITKSDTTKQSMQEASSQKNDTAKKDAQIKEKPKDDLQRQKIELANQRQPIKPKEKSDRRVQSVEEREQQQAKEQWLRLIPDEPGGLLREKFLRDYLRRQQGWNQ
ncbi:MAG: tetratricopeptide repeat protein [Legionella sp.]